jgi:hypothetical protein
MTDKGSDRGGTTTTLDLPEATEASAAPDEVPTPRRRQLPPKQVSKLFRQSQRLVTNISSSVTTDRDESKEQANTIQRNDHLHRLYLKEKLRRAIMKARQQQQEKTQPDGTAAVPVKVATVTAPPVPKESNIMEEEEDANDGEDTYLVQQLREEIQQESEMQVQGKVKEVMDILHERLGTDFGKGVTGGFPLEVRIQHFSYKAMRPNGGGAHVGDDGTKRIDTVYNTSCVYKLIRYFRKVMRCQARETRKLSSSEPFYMLHDINLVIEPGKQYLILGPPASGKVRFTQY